MDKIDALRKKLISSAKRKVQEKFEGKETHIIKSVNILDDLDSISNLLTEQLREWYSVYFPELDNIVKENDVYLRLVYSIGEKEKFTGKELEKIVGKKEADKIKEAAKKTMGSKIAKEDLAEMQTLALNAYNLKQEREYLTTYIEQSMKRELPNFTALAGPIIGAKILAKAGSKKKLAFMPASTIQLIGAEKALFLHIKTGAKGPKYGYLFQHPLIKTARKENKGRLARSLAAKLAIAAKKDYFGNTSPVFGMKKAIDERAKELSERKTTEKPETEEKPYRKRENNNFRKSNRTENKSFRKPTGKDNKKFGPKVEKSDFKKKKRKN